MQSPGAQTPSLHPLLQLWKGRGRLLFDPLYFNLKVDFQYLSTDMVLEGEG